MGRLKVTPKGKVKKNIPITRIGKKQYLKRRFAHVRAVDVAGSNNKLTQQYVAGQHLTAAQSFLHLGLRADASAPVEELKANVAKIRESRRKINAFAQQEEEIKKQNEQKKANYIGRPVSEQESSMIGALLLAYGTDIKRMTYDPKLNPFQLNARQLQRQIVNYLKWEKAAFPKEFAEAEKRGWFSIGGYADPKLRLGTAGKGLEDSKVEKKSDEKQEKKAPKKTAKSASAKKMQAKKA